MTIKFISKNGLENYRFQTIKTKEPETIFWIDNYISSKDTFIDIGANVGIYSIYTALKKIKVFALESFKKNFKLYL